MVTSSSGGRTWTCGPSRYERGAL